MNAKTIEEMAAISPESGNYMGFRNETKTHIYFEVWNPGGWKGWYGEASPGADGPMYKPSYQSIWYEVVIWDKFGGGKLASAWPVYVEKKGKTVRFKQLSDGTYHVCVDP